MPASSHAPWTAPSLLRHGVATALPIALAIALAAALVQPKRSTLNVESSPAGAAVWVDDQYAGLAPVQVSRLARGRHLVVAEKYGYQAWREPVVLAKATELVRAELAPVEHSSIEVTTTPPGALVVLDGQAKGRTPITIDDVPPGPHQLRLAKRGCVPQESAVNVAQGKLARVHVALDSSVEALYLERIAKEPRNFHHVLELAHHYVLNHDFGKAEKTLMRVKSLLRGQPGMDDGERRLYQELDKIHEAQFDYGDYQAVKQGQAMVRRVLEAYVAAQDRNAYARYQLARVYRREGQYQKAKEQLRRARAATSDSGLRRLIDREMRQVGR